MMDDAALAAQAKRLEKVGLWYVKANNWGMAHHYAYQIRLLAHRASTEKVRVRIANRADKVWLRMHNRQLKLFRKGDNGC